MRKKIPALTIPVSLDLGFDPAEAEIMALRAEVMIRIEQRDLVMNF